MPLPVVVGVVPTFHARVSRRLVCVCGLCYPRRARRSALRASRLSILSANRSCMASALRLLSLARRPELRRTFMGCER